MQRIYLAAIGVCLLGPGCISKAKLESQLRQDNPRQQTAAIAQIVRRGDGSMVGNLIRLLDSDDEGVRFMAATALHQLTGVDRGFHFAGPEKRQVIVAEWHDWYKTETGNDVPELPKPEAQASDDEALDPAGEPAPPASDPATEAAPTPTAAPAGEDNTVPPPAKPAEQTPGEYSLPEIEPPRPTSPSAEAKEKVG